MNSPDGSWDSWEGSAPCTVLICDTESARAASIARVLRGCGERIERIERVGGAGAPALVAAGRLTVALVAVDGGAPVLRATLDFLQTLRRHGCSIVCYGQGVLGWPVELHARVLLAGALAILDAAADSFTADVASRAGELLHHRRQQRQEEAHCRLLLRGLGIVGESAAMLDVFRWIVRISPLSDLPALLQGETGTGKEVIATAIHRLDPKRRERPFVAVNCAAINATLAETEFFGHRRGAFTGADRDRKGFFRAADGGVLFLDEIGDLDLALQGKLLRVLQEGRVLTVGEDREVDVDLRVVAATNRDLYAMVERGGFRADLYHRLNVLTVRIPPLRERPADLAPLVSHFLQKYDSLAPGTPPQPTPCFVAAVARLDLAGNIRELENLVRRVLVAKRDAAPLDMAHLPPELLERLLAAALHDAQAGAAADAAPPPPPDLFDPARILGANDWNLARSLDYCERRLMQTALGEAGGNHSRAARLLGLTPRSIYNKVRKYSLER